MFEVLTAEEARTLFIMLGEGYNHSRRMSIQAADMLNLAQSDRIRRSTNQMCNDLARVRQEITMLRGQIKREVLDV